MKEINGAPRVVVAALISALAVGLAACGTQSSTGSSGTIPSSHSSIPAPSLSPNEVTTGVTGLAPIPQTAAQAKAFVTQLETRPTSIVWNTPLSRPIPKNKTLAVIEIGVPDVVNIDNWIQKASTDAGWSMKRIQAGLTAETFKAAMDQAVRMKPSAVLLTSYPTAVYASELQQLNAMNIPVIGLTVASPTGGGLIAALAGGPRYVRWGQVMAAEVSAASGGSNANTLVTLVPDYSTASYVQQGFTQAYPVLCPKNCSYHVLNFSATDIGTNVPSQIVSYLQAHPNVHYLAMYGTFMATGVVPALRAAGLLNQVTIFTHDLDPSTAQDMAAGVNETDYSAAPAEMAYRAVDILIRYLSGDQTWKQSADTGLPEWITTPKNLPAGATSGYQPTVANVQAEYRKLWHIS